MPSQTSKNIRQLIVIWTRTMYKQYDADSRRNSLKACNELMCKAKHLGPFEEVHVLSDTD